MPLPSPYRSSCTSRLLAQAVCDGQRAAIRAAIAPSAAHRTTPQPPLSSEGAATLLPTMPAAKHSTALRATAWQTITTGTTTAPAASLSASPPTLAASAKAVARPSASSGSALVASAAAVSAAAAASTRARHCAPERHGATI